MKAGNSRGDVFYIVICQDSAAEIGLKHGQEGVIIACFKQNLGLDAGIGKNCVNESPHGRLFVHDDKRLVLKCTDIHSGVRIAPGRPYFCGRMDRRHSQKNLFRVYGFIGIAGPVFIRQRQETDIKISLGNQLLKVPDYSFPGHDGNVGILLMENGIGGSKHGGTSSGSEAYGQMSPFALGQIMDHLIGIPFDLKDLSGIADIGFPGFCQMPVCPGTVKQGSAQVFFQF